MKIYLRETIITVINSINITKIMKLEDINNIFRFKDVFIRTTIDVPVFKFYKIKFHKTPKLVKIDELKLSIKNVTPV